MSDETVRQEGNPVSGTLRDSDIKTTRVSGRRSLLRSFSIGLLGAGVLGAAAITTGETARDFPKGSSDNDRTTNKDLKAVDSDARDSKAVDSDQNKLRDVRRSGDSD